MSKQPTARMIKFASDIGAIKNGKPDWYRVAEELATIAIPELLEGKPGSQASSTELSFICTFHLSKKDFYERRYVFTDVARDFAGKPIRGADGKVLVTQKTKIIEIGNPWKGLPAAPPHKLICSATATRELLDYGNGAEVLGTLLSEDIAVSLDAAILSAAPASSVRPAGILNSIASLTPTTGGNEAALRGDIALLAGVVGSTGSANVAFIVSPTYALKLRLEFGTVSKCSATKLAK